MAKVTVEVTGAYVDGKAPGSTLSIEEKSAKHLESLGYVKLAKEAPKAKSKGDKADKPSKSSKSDK